MCPRVQSLTSAQEKHNSRYISQESTASLQTCQARGAAQAPDSQVGFNFQPTGTAKSFHSRFVFHLYRH